jgi:hypothetical protein
VLGTVLLKLWIWSLSSTCSILEVISLMMAHCSWKNVENLEELSTNCMIYLVSALVICNLWYMYVNYSQQHSGMFLTWTKLALSSTVTKNFMALDVTVNSNPLLNINVGEYGQYCLKTVYQIGTIVLYVIKKFLCMQRRGLWKVRKWVMGQGR